MSNPSATLQPKIYTEYIEKYKMTHEIPAHGLMFYAMSLGLVLEANDKQYGHEVSYKVEAESIMCAAESMYGVSRTHMVKFWPEIERIYNILNIKPIPNKLEYRHKSVLIVPDNEIITGTKGMLQ